MLATVHSATLVGVVGHPVQVKVHATVGLPGFELVGLPDTSRREARDRIRAALLSSGLRWPALRLTVNLVTRGTPRLSAGLDLAVAIGILAADGQLDPRHLTQRAFVGELGLDGSLRPVPGLLPLVEAVTVPEVVVPVASVAEAHAGGGHRVRQAGNLCELVAALSGRGPWPGPPPEPPVVEPADHDLAPGLRGVGRLPTVRRAALIAAAGGHHLLVVGHGPSTATALARWLVGVLPELADDHALEVTRVHSAAGLPLPRGVLVRRPPLRLPHSSASAVSLIGGGSSHVGPGEASLSHRGVLVLGELGEFSPAVLDHVRQPMATGMITVTRAGTRVVLPARFQLVAAMRRCPCDADTPDGCRCSGQARERYARRISGPLLDGFGLFVDSHRAIAGLGGELTMVPMSALAQRVSAARLRAHARGVACNAELEGTQLDEIAPLSSGARGHLDRAVRDGQLARGGYRVVHQVALTIADLFGTEPPLSREHAALALALRAARPGGGPGMSRDLDRTLDLDRLVEDARTIASGPSTHPAWRLRDALTGLADLIERQARRGAADKYVLDAIAVLLQQPGEPRKAQLPKVVELVAATGRDVQPLYWPRVARLTGVVHLATDDGVTLCGARTEHLLGREKVPADVLRERAGRNTCGLCEQEASIPQG